MAALERLQEGIQVPLAPIPTAFSTHVLLTSSSSSTAPTTARSNSQQDALAPIFTSRPARSQHVPHETSTTSPNRAIASAGSRFFSAVASYFRWVRRPQCHETSKSQGRAGPGEKHSCRHPSIAEQPQDSHAQALEDIMQQSDYWDSSDSRSVSWSPGEDAVREIPQYVLDYAPYVHLFSGEEFWPCDIAEHLQHTTPRLNYTPISGMEHDRTLDNLAELNQYGRYAFLTSDDNVEERPEWLGGSSNIPETPGLPSSKGHPQPGGHSSAPAILVVVPKPGGIVDAFWFYFYSYNLGNKVLNVRFGNHVGDWEHTLVRFRDGEPEHVFLSEHNFGDAYSYQALEKIGKRPLTFSATGSHAMYAQPGLHPYVLPWGLLHDQTDRGPLWDPSMNLHSYTYDLATDTLLASNRTPHAPTDWFYYRGHWGDRAYPMSDKRQYQFAGQYHYVSGPIGARFKSLGRQKVCQGHGECHIRNWLPPSPEVKAWPGGDTEGDMDATGAE